MSELEKIQSKVNDVYYKHLAKYEGGLNLSFPHVPLISEAYLKNRIIIIGQETSTWYRKGDDDLKNVYFKNYQSSSDFDPTLYYKEFVDGLAGANRGFWKFSKKLYVERVISGPIQENGYLNHCWINLFSVEAIPKKGSKGKEKTDGQPTQNEKLRKEVLKLQGSLLYDLMVILKPKILIALTGHKLNGVLFADSLGLSFEDGKNHMIWKDVDPNGILVDRNISEVEIIKENHPLRETKIIQAYHPNYFMGRINTIKKLKKRLEENQMDMSTSDYYQKVLFDWIRNQLQSN